MQWGGGGGSSSSSSNNSKNTNTNTNNNTNTKSASSSPSPISPVTVKSDWDKDSGGVNNLNIVPGGQIDRDVTSR